MTEERKHAILFATTLLCARKIIEVIDTDASMRMGKQHWPQRVIAALLGVPLLLRILWEAYFQSFGFYAEYWTMPIGKYGVRTPLRWQERILFDWQ